MISFSKKQFLWKSTIYVLGLPRSGKSTVYNLIASCRDVEGVDEPFELQLTAQKGGECEPSSPHFAMHNDSYLAMMENYFSELVLGRRYNFRSIDKSYVLNVKSRSAVDINMSRAGRSDVRLHAKSANLTFVVAYNNVEKALDFITHEVPSPKIIYVRRNTDKVVQAIAEKEWLSDEQLSSQANLASSFRSVFQRGSRLLYIPYQIPEHLVAAFVSADNLGRVEIYCKAQAESFEAALGRVRGSCLRVEFEDLQQDSEAVVKELFRFGNLQAGELTPRLLADLKTRPIGDSMS